MSASKAMSMSPRIPVSSALRTRHHNYRMTKPLQRRMRAAAKGDMAKERAAAVDGAVELAVSAPGLARHREAADRDVRIASIADALFSRGCRHEATFSNIGYLPMGNPSIPEVAFAGRSRCGITSLLRALFKSRSAADRGNASSRRDVINSYSVGGSGSGDYGGGFSVLETPGFGARTVPWAVVLQHCSLLRSLCLARPSLKMLYYVMDCSEASGLSYRDMDTLKFLSEEIKNFTIVLSKADKNKDMQSIHEQLRYQGIEHPVLVTSAWTLGGIDTLRFDMVESCLHSLPTERLSMGEVRRLGERIVSLNQVAVGAAPPRLLHRPITTLDEECLIEQQQQRQQLLLGESATAQVAESKVTDLQSMGDDTSPASSSSSSTCFPVASTASSSSSTAPGLYRRPSAALLTLSARARIPNWLLHPNDPKHNKFLQPPSQQFLRYVAQTSPLRNPYKWPAHVALTASKRINVVKLPEDPENPYLFQPRFVVPRADWNFRRPSIKYRKHQDNKGRGHYLSNAPAYFSRQFTIPFYPDIIDIRMDPQPVAFVGSATYYDRGPEGKKLALRARSDAVSPLIDVTRPMSSSSGSDAEPDLLLEQPGVKKLGGGLAQALRQLDAKRKQQQQEQEQQQKSLPVSDVQSAPKLDAFSHASF